MVRSRAAALLTGGVVMVAVVATAWFFLVPKSDIQIESLLLDDMPAPPTVAEDKWVVKLTEEADASWLAAGGVRRIWSTVNDNRDAKLGVLYLNIYEHRNSWLASRAMSNRVERYENNWGQEIHPPTTTVELHSADQFEIGCFASGLIHCEAWSYIARYEQYVVALHYSYGSPIGEEDFEELVLETDEHIGEMLSD